MRTKQEISEFIIHELKRKNITKSSLGAALGAEGISQKKVQKASQFLNPSSSKIDLDDLAKVSKFLGIHPGEILLKERDWKKSAESLSDIHLHKNHLVPLFKPTVIPSINNKDSDIEEWIVLPWINNRGRFIAVIVPDDAMSQYVKNTVVFIDTQTHRYNLEHESVLAVSGTWWGIRSFNRTHNSIELKCDTEAKSFAPTDALNIIGVATHILRPIQR